MKGPFIILLSVFLIKGGLNIQALTQSASDVLQSEKILISDSTRINELYKRAKELLVESDYSLAEAVGLEAFEMASAAGDQEMQLKILSVLSEVQISQNFYENAIIYQLQVVGLLESMNDSTRLVHAYASAAGSYYRVEIYDKAGENYRKAFDILPDQYFPERAAYLENMGYCALYAGRPDSAVFFFSKQRMILIQLKKDDTKALQNLVKASNSAGKYEDALNYNQLIFERFRMTEMYSGMSSVKNNMAYNLTLLGRYEEAAEAYKEAVQYGTSSGMADKDHAILLTNEGICLYNAGNSKEALKCFRNAVNLFNSAGLMQEKGRVENMIAQVYYNEGDLYNAGLYCQQAIESLEDAGDDGQLAQSYFTYSRVLRDGNDPITALEYYERYLSIKDSLGFEDKMEEEKLTALKLQLEKSEKDLSLKAKGEELRKLSVQQLKMQLEKEERDKELLLREAEVEGLERERLEQEIRIARQQNLAEQQEKARRQLEWENELKDARLMQDSLKQVSQKKEIESLETQKEIDRLSIEKQKSTRKLMTWIAVLMVVAALSVLGGLITTRRKNILLASQKKEIEEQNTNLELKNEEIIAQRDEIESQRDLLMDQKQQIEQIHTEITKSIEYAKKIQTSTLPDIQLLTDIAKEYFVFFRPRDIVSGDFYWIGNVENTSVVAVADCTGHGVPGAFMSMLGISLLKEIVLKEYITQPAVILRRLRKEIIAALGQKGIAGEQKDGMDMSLISIDHATRKVEYAGAYNSVYIIREKSGQPLTGGDITMMDNDQYVLYNLHADKMPVALYDRMDKFTNYEIQCKEGDQLYLFTDGYADQFGGPFGKKFMYKPFMNLLLSNAYQPMEDQCRILTDTFNEWSGNLAQVDDICVMGLKL